MGRMGNQPSRKSNLKCLPTAGLRRIDTTLRLTRNHSPVIHRSEVRPKVPLILATPSQRLRTPARATPPLTELTVPNTANLPRRATPTAPPPAPPTILSNNNNNIIPNHRPRIHTVTLTISTRTNNTTNSRHSNHRSISSSNVCQRRLLRTRTKRERQSRRRPAWSLWERK